jgi:hypothetical protein
LIYRTHQEHLVKTNHHGDGAQFSDWALIRRERRRQKKADETVKKKRSKSRRPKSAVKRKFKWPKRSFSKKEKGR